MLRGNLVKRRRIPLLVGVWVSVAGMTDALVAQAERAGGPGRSTSAAFVENRGQWPEPVRFMLRGRDGALWAEDRGLTLLAARAAGTESASPHAVRISFEETAGPVAVSGAERRSGVHHYFVGNDPARWATDVPRFGVIVYEELWSGVGLHVVRREGRVDMALAIEDGDDVDRVKLRVQGAHSPTIGADGALGLETRAGIIRIPAPSIRLKHGGMVVAARYVRLSSDEFGVRIADSDDSAEGEGTEGLDWSTYLGGSDVEHISDLVCGPDGSLTVIGDSESPDYPTTADALDAILSGNRDIVLSRLTATGDELVFSTYVGGSSGEDGHCLALAPDGVLLVGGKSVSLDFPITRDAVSTSKQGTWDMVVLRLAPNGDEILYSTYFGGIAAGVEIPRAIHADALGVITVAGEVSVSDYPTTPGAFQGADPDGFAQVYDGFVTRFASGGTELVFSTYLGGSGHEHLKAMVVDPSGDVIVTGDASSSTFIGGDFPTTPGAYNESSDGHAFVTRLSADGTSLVWSTGLGGEGGFSVERGWAVGLDRAGNVLVVGETPAPDFPVTPDAFDKQLNSSGAVGAVDLFVAKLDPTGSELLYGSYLGGSHDESIFVDAAWDSAGAVTVTTYTRSTNFPTSLGAHDNDASGLVQDTELGIARLHPSGTSLMYGTYLGGSASEPTACCLPIAIDATGAAIVGGSTNSRDFPVTPGAADGEVVGFEGFVTRLSMLPTGVTRFGASTPGCEGAIAIGAYQMPQVGVGDFFLTCTNAPTSAVGWLALSLGDLATPVGVGGADLWIDPSQLVLVLPQTSDGFGWSEQRFTIRNHPSLVGIVTYAQYVWPNDGLPPKLAASNALRIETQP